MNCDREISYFERKQQNTSNLCKLNTRGIPALVKSYKSLDLLKDSGLEFISSNPIFNEIETSLYPESQFSPFRKEETRYSFLYIISKNIGEQLYFKFGSGGKTKQIDNLRLNRIEGAQTFLIPGIGDNTGFKVHFMFFYKNASYLDKASIHDFIEKSVHHILQQQFKASNIKFGTENPSEWYLVKQSRGKSETPSFFCGFIIDVLTTYANRNTQLAPSTVWKLSEKKNKSKQVKLPAIEETENRLKEENGTYDKIQKMLASRGLRNEREYVIIEEGDQNTLLSKKGNIKEYKAEIMKKGEIVKEGNETIGSLFEFPPNSGKKYIITDIVLNRLKYSFGQPLEYNEIYAKFKPQPNNNMEIEKFEKKKISISTKISSNNDNENEYYMKIENLLEIIKPHENIENWPLKKNYDYYQMRSKGKNYTMYEIKKNVEVPDWYFNPTVQDTWAKIFSGSNTNQKFAEYQRIHTDTRHHDPNDQKTYEWKVVARIYRKNENKKTKQNILLKRETTTTDNQKIEEEIPITRLMMLYNIPKSVKETIHTKSSIWHKGKEIKKDFTCLLPAGYFDVDYREKSVTSNEKYTFRVHKVYIKTLKQDEVIIENIDYMEIGQIYPWTKNKTTLNVPISSLELGIDNIVVLSQPKVKKDTVLKFMPADIKKINKVYCGDETEFQNKIDDNYYSVQSVNTLGIINNNGLVRPKEYHYATVTKIMTTDKYIYEITYFPPYDKISPWPVPTDKYINASVSKKFGNTTHKGTVLFKDTESDTGTPMWRVLYEDKDEEDLYENQLEVILEKKHKKGLHNNPKKSVRHYVCAADIDNYLDKHFHIVQKDDRYLNTYLKNLKAVKLNNKSKKNISSVTLKQRRSKKASDK